jgi:hypothetical protein
LPRPPRIARHQILLILAGTGLVALTGAFALLSPRFGYAYLVADMPVFAAVALLVAAGLIYQTLPPLIGKAPQARHTERLTLIAIVIVGVLMRLSLLASEPVLEDDYQRYLWDGGQTAHALNPYVATPEAAKSADPDSSLGQLARESGDVLGRVNHPQLKTLYPPLAQAAFALAHWLGPWSLTAWRLVCLACDGAAFGLILLLLAAACRPAAWSALYWWNPLVVKEVVNSAHMDVLLLPLVLAALLLAVRSRPLLATAALVAAAGIKIWPALLLPLIWRPLLARPAALGLAVAASIFAAGVFAWPMLASGLDASSGLVAYAKGWTTNSALFPLIERMFVSIQTWLGLTALEPALLSRGLVGLALAVLALVLARRDLEDADDLMQRSAILVVALFLLMPAQFPWYYLWIAPFLPFVPLYGLLILTATLPLYYASFYFIARDAYDVFSEQLVWFIWLPAWALLALWFARSRSQRSLAPTRT